VAPLRPLLLVKWAFIFHAAGEAQDQAQQSALYALGNIP
jgi:hypothetical protein